MRRNAGFATAYAFYNRNGGRRAFPFTFAHYLKFENGSCLPRPQWLPELVSLLRIPPTDEMFRRFVTDFLRDFFGAEENYLRLVGPLLSPVENEIFGRQAAKKLLAGHSYHLTPSQHDVILSSPASYWTFECLANDKGAWSAAELAAVTGLPRARIATGLKALAKARLVRRAGLGRYRSPVAGRYYAFPTGLPNQAKRRLRREAYVAAMTRNRGETLEDSFVVFRGGAAEARQAITALYDLLEASAAEAVFEPTPSSSLVLIQARCLRALDY